MEIRRERLWPRIGWSYESEIFIYKKNYWSLFPFLINLQVLHESGVFLGVICVVRRDPAGTVSGGGKKSKRGGGGILLCWIFFLARSEFFPPPLRESHRILSSFLESMPCLYFRGFLGDYSPAMPFGYGENQYGVQRRDRWCIWCCRFSGGKVLIYLNDVFFFIKTEISSIWFVLDVMRVVLRKVTRMESWKVCKRDVNWVWWKAVKLVAR